MLGGENKHLSAAPAAGGVSETAKTRVGMERRLGSCCSSQGTKHGNLVCPGDKMMAQGQMKAEEGMEGAWLQPGMGP